MDKEGSATIKSALEADAFRRVHVYPDPVEDDAAFVDIVVPGDAQPADVTNALDQSGLMLRANGEPGTGSRTPLLRLLSTHSQPALVDHELVLSFEDVNTPPREQQ